MGDASEQDQQLVRSHYDQRKSLGIAGREESRTFKVRTLHNWIKFALIEFDEHARRRSRPVVLDLCCGKGGDLNKFARVRARGVVCVDWARKSVEEAVRRWGSMRERFPVEFYCADCFEVDLGAHLHADLRFDLCSCQFSAHYAFASEGRARAMLRNVSSRLVPGGAAVLTLPDADELARRLRASGGDGFGNGFYRVRFDAGSAGRARAWSSRRGPRARRALGVRYEFYLEDSVGEAAGPGALELVPEFLAPLATLRRLAAEAGLELVFARNFRRSRRSWGGTGAGGGAAADAGGCAGHPLEALSPDEWEVSSLYAAVAFRKAAAAPGAGPSRKRDRDEERDARQQGHHPRREGDPGGPYDDRGDNAYSRQSDSGYSDLATSEGGTTNGEEGTMTGEEGDTMVREAGTTIEDEDTMVGGQDTMTGEGGTTTGEAATNEVVLTSGEWGTTAGERACPIVLVPGFSASDIRSLP
eukprot:tig00000383_g24709.t1